MICFQPTNPRLLTLFTESFISRKLGHFTLNFMIKLGAIKHQKTVSNLQLFERVTKVSNKISVKS